MYFLVSLYLAAIVAANLLVATFGPGVSIVNAFALIALDLTSRDRLHEAWARARFGVTLSEHEADAVGHALAGAALLRARRGLRTQEGRA